jgi:drug/metabolite transporter (DMT)-like permease
MRVRRIDSVLFAVLALSWGSSYLFIKIGVGSLPPFMLIAGRLGIGALLLGIVLAIAREPLPRDRVTYGKLLIMAIVNIAIPFTLITFAERSIDSVLAVILNATVPLFTIVIAAAVLPEEAITVGRVAGLGVGFVGVVVLVGRGLGADIAGDGPWGELALLGSSFCYGLGNVYSRRAVPGLRPMVPAFFQVFLAFLITATMSLLLEQPWAVRPAPEAVFAVVWLGILGSALAYLIYFRLLRAWGPTRLSTVAYLLPLVGIVLGVVILGEAIDARILLGTALILGGVALVNSRRGRRRLAGRAVPMSVQDPAA